MQFRQWLFAEDNQQIGILLQKLYQADQNERRQYQSYLSQYPNNWQQAAIAWVKDKNRDPNDIFDDTKRLQLAKKLIQNNIDLIRQNKQWLQMAWLLVQHMDHDIPFQLWFVQYLRGNNRKYLTDRILVNQGLPQKYGTQNV